MRNKQLLIENLKVEFVKVPNKVFRIGLSPIAIVLYIHYLTYSEKFHPSISYLCKILKLSKPSVIKYKRELEVRGLIKKYFKGGLGKTAKYEFTPPKSWKYAKESKIVLSNREQTAEWLHNEDARIVDNE
jgi:hypothetical protein